MKVKLWHKLSWTVYTGSRLLKCTIIVLMPNDAVESADVES